MGFLIANKEDFKKSSIKEFDFILVSGDAYVDHPSFGVAIISRVLESKGFTVGIIPQPDWTNLDSFKIYGKPKYGFLVTSGNIDSMVNHYTVEREYRNKGNRTRRGRREGEEEQAKERRKRGRRGGRGKRENTERGRTRNRMEKEDRERRKEVRVRVQIERGRGRRGGGGGGGRGRGRGRGGGRGSSHLAPRSRCLFC